MYKCCTIQLTRRPQRRTNGLQLPLNYLQILGWIVFTVTALVNFLLVVQIQFHELKSISLIIYSFLYVFHIVSHIAACFMDPGEKDLRKQSINTLPEFDRTIHAHVIENGRCHLCNINTTDKKTKHCGICNKCVYHFDHHCKWLNNCVGQRNYAVFILCVISALLLAVFTLVLCIIDLYFFLKSPQKLSTAAQNFINCTEIENNFVIEQYCKNSISFLIFLVMFSISALAIACALLHLLCFHIYISLLGISTYEYIMRNTHAKSQNNFKCCRINIRRLYIVNNSKTRSNTIVSPEHNNGQNVAQKQNTEPSMKNLINTLVADELIKAKKFFLYENNKIHPSKDVTDERS